MHDAASVIVSEAWEVVIVLDDQNHPLGVGWNCDEVTQQLCAGNGRLTLITASLIMSVEDTH